jgi:hypothetical protein
MKKVMRAAWNVLIGALVALGAILFSAGVAMLLYFVATSQAFGQTTPSPGSFMATRTTTLSGAAEVITIQTATTAPRLLHFRGLAIYCSVACDVTLERDGTAATATSFSIVPINQRYPASVAAAYRSSDVGTGTVLSTYSLTAGGLLPLDLTDKYVYPGENLTLRTSSITGTVRITFQWEELRP